MGALLSSLFALLWRSNKRHKVVIVGLDNAGKTTALYKLQLGAPLAVRRRQWHCALTALRAPRAGEIVCTTPTVGANMEELTFQNVHFEARNLPSSAAQRTLTRFLRPKCWDLGGQQQLRMSWTAYFQDTDAVVLVVDSTDRMRTALVKARSMTLRPRASRAHASRAPAA